MHVKIATDVPSNMLKRNADMTAAQVHRFRHIYICIPHETQYHFKAETLLTSEHVQDSDFPICSSLMDIDMLGKSIVEPCAHTYYVFNYREITATPENTFLHFCIPHETCYHFDMENLEAGEYVIAYIIGTCKKMGLTLENGFRTNVTAQDRLQRWCGRPPGSECVSVGKTVGAKNA